MKMERVQTRRCGRSNCGQLNRTENAQVESKFEHAPKESLDSVRAREHDPIEFGQATDRGVDRSPVVRVADIDCGQQVSDRSQVLQATKHAAGLMLWPRHQDAPTEEG